MNDKDQISSELERQAEETSRLIRRTLDRKIHSGFFEIQEKIRTAIDTEDYSEIRDLTTQDLISIATIASEATQQKCIRDKTTGENLQKLSKKLKEEEQIDSHELSDLLNNIDADEIITIICERNPESSKSLLYLLSQCDKYYEYEDPELAKIVEYITDLYSSSSKDDFETRKKHLNQHNKKFHNGLKNQQTANKIKKLI